MQFEFKTKSTNIEGLLKEGGAENIVVAWSVNAAPVIEQAEHFTPSLQERLAASARVVQAGYRTAFHFDPVIIYDGWQEDYAQTAQALAQAVPADKVAWISVGTLRFSRELKKMMETRFPEGKLLDGEFLLDFDGKMRYGDAQRLEVYRYLVPLLKKLFPKTVVYLCMEDPQVVKAVYQNL